MAFMEGGVLVVAKRFKGSVLEGSPTGSSGQVLSPIPMGLFGSTEISTFLGLLKDKINKL